jgi:hypothetical protein
MRRSAVPGGNIGAWPRYHQGASSAVRAFTGRAYQTAVAGFARCRDKLTPGGRLSMLAGVISSDLKSSAACGEVKDAPQ